MDPPKPVAARQKEPKNDPVTTTAAVPGFMAAMQAMHPLGLQPKL